MMAQQSEGSVEMPRPHQEAYQPPPPPHDDTQAAFQDGGRTQVRSETNNPPQPMKEAISTTSESTEPFSAALERTPSDAVDPNLVAHITEQVINNLKLNGISNNGSPSLSKVQSNSSVTGSSTQGAAPFFLESQHDQGLEEVSPLSPNSQNLDGHEDERNDSRRAPQYPNSGSHSSQSKERPRPQAPPREPTDDTSTLEKIWQPLFTADGEPTPRLGQFLRGLAIHIIEDFEPLNSLVIPPSKMLGFYEKVNLPEEVYPWKSIFGGKITHSSLSHIYRDLECQHHFIQHKSGDKPHIPSLTPAGFETWMSCVIRAHPDLEYNRFAIAVRNLPISNADNPKERFPKELSRRLFPTQQIENALFDLEDAILADREIELTPFGIAERERRDAAEPFLPASKETDSSRRPFQEASKSNDAAEASSLPSSSTAMPREFSTKISPPPLPQTASSNRVSPPPLERNRQADYTPRSTESALEDTPLSAPIERNRQPYHAAPGGGKTYDGESRIAVPEPTPAPRSYTSATTARPVLEPQDDYEVPPRLRAGSLATGATPSQRYNSPPRGAHRPSKSVSVPDVLPQTYEPTAPHVRFDDSAQGLGRRPSKRDQRRGSREEQIPLRDAGPPSHEQTHFARDPGPSSRIRQSPSRSEYDDERHRRGGEYPPHHHHHHHQPPPPPSSSRHS